MTEDNKKWQDYTKQEKKDTYIGFAILAGLLFSVFFGWDIMKGGWNLVFGGDNYKKERCINETRNIKNEFTAKKMYKKCMKR